jgi:hypothetical protein
VGPFDTIKENKFPYYRLPYNWNLPLVLSKDSRPLIRLLGISPYTRLRIERMRTTQNAEKQNAVLGTFPAISFIAIVAHGDTALSLRRVERNTARPVCAILPNMAKGPGIGLNGTLICLCRPNKSFCPHTKKICPWWNQPPIKPTWTHVRD